MLGVCRLLIVKKLRVLACIRPIFDDDTALTHRFAYEAAIDRGLIVPVRVDVVFYAKAGRIMQTFSIDVCEMMLLMT